MSVFIKRKLPVITAFLLCFAVILSVILSLFFHKDETNAKTETVILNLWQIDSFEGGKGSRSGYLKSLAESFAKSENCYINVSALSADAARLNIEEGNLPDIISYGAGTYGLEGVIRGKQPYRTWCRGGYCFITLDDTADFSDITKENTVINGGTENFAGAAALFCGIENAVTAKPTEAYLKLINGKFKYLLGTQRDIFRFRTREVSFKIKPVTEYNDLYQNISLTTTNEIKIVYAEKFIQKLLSEGKKVEKIGLMRDGEHIYDDEMREMENISFKYKLISPVSVSTVNEINSAITNKDLKKLKNLCI